MINNQNQSTSVSQKRQRTSSEYCSPSSVVMMISSSSAGSTLGLSGWPLMRTSAVTNPLLATATAVMFGLFAGFFGLPFFFWAFDDRLGAAWSSTVREWSVVDRGLTRILYSRARCNAFSAMHRTCIHLRQSPFEHCTISSSGFCGASSMHIRRNA